MPRLPDPLRSQAVLIGCGRYEKLADIPAIANNVHDLAGLLTGNELPTTTVIDPADPLTVSTALVEAADNADDVLLIYFAGHGLVDERGGLYLGLPRTDPAHMRWTSLPYQEIRETLLRSRAVFRIIILDCSYSARAFSRDSISDSGPARVAVTATAALGSVVLASSAPNEHSYYSSGSPYTAFTGELLRTLSQGIPGGSEILTVDAIYANVAASMRALGHQSPLRMQTSSRIGDDVGLIRNPAYDPSRESERPLGEPTPADVGGHTIEPTPDHVDEPVGDDIEWSHDAPAVTDLLHRGPIATVISMRLTETHTSQPTTSFLMHIDGPWGSGKSTLLNLLETRLDGYFRVVRFDAWQQSRLAPAWWSLLTTLRAEVATGRSWWVRPWFRLTESVERMRRTGATYATALAFTILLAVVVGYFIYPKDSTAANWLSLARIAAAAITVLGAVWTGAYFAARLLLWDSIRGARLFEQTQVNPMSEIAVHFRWLIDRSDKPVVFFIDDLDRCAKEYVVEFLDMIQTLVRSVGGAAGQRRAAYFVIAADGMWLRRSYECAHDSFVDMSADLGRPLGYLFLDKLFQLTIPMPALTGTARSSFLDNMLRIAASTEATAAQAFPSEPPTAEPDNDPRPGRLGRLMARTRPRTRQAEPSPEELRQSMLDRLQELEEGRARQIVTAMSRSSERRRTEHTLRKFSEVIGHNPRSAKKFVNTYSIIRSIRFLEDAHPNPDTLALWCLISVRWPNIAHHLADHPEAVAGIADPLWRSDHFPEELRTAAALTELRGVVMSTDGGPLTPALIRQCCGAKYPAVEQSKL
ncbi:P-loop NTPase fold protein [Nocardia sp. NPDC050710]|uniref:caspase, EACC1-associated type n=1 Tax=Nocardia sp. NPDC050710 TaxID=3157220 RepID=UPI0034046290